MRFTWISNAPWVPSGYGQQTRIATNRLAELGHDIGIICFYGLEGGVMQIGPRLWAFPKRYNPYGNDICVAHTGAFGAQFMLSLMDTWVMNPEEYPAGMRWVAWYPVDHDPMPALVREKLNSAWRRIAMSKFGVTKTHEAGLDCSYIPHSVETALFHPQDKAACRDALGLPQDRWIVGTVAMNKGNPSRKNFVEMMTAFARLKTRHPDALYFLQTDRGDNVPDMVNLPELASNLGLQVDQDIVFCNQYQNATGYPVDYLPRLYGALDAHMLVSAGEGFGIPTLEAQACAIPVIVGDWTAHTELCHCGRMVAKADAEPYYSPLASYLYRPHAAALADLLIEEYEHPTDAAPAAEWAKAEYDADAVVERYWKPELAAIEEALQ